MVTPTAINPPALGKAVGFSHGMRAGNLLFVAGQIGARPDKDGKPLVVSSDFAEQFEVALDNVLQVVRAAGGQATSLVELTIFVTELHAYERARPALAGVWKRHLGRYYPAVTLVEVAGLYEPGSIVEIRAVAALE